MSDWHSTTLQEIISTIESGSRPKGGVRIGDNSEGVPSYGGENISMNGGMLYDSVRMVPTNFATEMRRGVLSDKDVLINKDGANTGKSAIYRKPAGEEFATINEHLFLLRCNKGIADQEFLYHFLNSELGKSQIARVITGSAQPGLNSTFPEFVRIDLPPLPEQKKIAEILSGIDHSLAKLSNKLNALTRLRIQLIRQFLTHEVHPQSNHEGILPLDWQVKTLDEVAQFRRGSFPQPYGNPEWFDDNGFPFVQVFDIDDNGKLKSSTKSRISKAGAEKSVFIPCGSLIVSLQGSIGRVAITQYDAYVDRTILIFTDYQKDLDREYFSLLIGDLFSRQGEVADGGVIKTITKQTLKDFSIKIPPLNEQKRMSKVVFALDRHISLYKKKLLKGNFLKQSLMGDLLSGRKRVSI